MKEIEILGANRFDAFTRTREGSRAIIVQDGMILLSHETVSGWYLVPGGGLESGETPEKQNFVEEGIFSAETVTDELMESREY